MWPADTSSKEPLGAIQSEPKPEDFPLIAWNILYLEVMF